MMHETRVKATLAREIPRVGVPHEAAAGLVPTHRNCAWELQGPGYTDLLLE